MFLQGLQNCSFRGLHCILRLSCSPSPGEQTLEAQPYSQIPACSLQSIRAGILELPESEYFVEVRVSRVSKVSGSSGPDLPKAFLGRPLGYFYVFPSWAEEDPTY